MVQKGQICLRMMSSNISPASALRWGENSINSGSPRHRSCLNKIFFPVYFVPPSFSWCHLGETISMRPLCEPPGHPYPSLDSGHSHPVGCGPKETSQLWFFNYLITPPEDLKRYISSQWQTWKVTINIRAKWFIPNLFFKASIALFCFWQ